LFVVRLAAGDSDNDELPDDWEMNFFGNLNETGSGDVDEDGFSNLAEFKAGTNPTNNSSLLRVITLTSATTGRVTLLWSAVPGRRYRVEFTNALDGPNWTALGDEVLSASDTASVVDETATAAQRFYRVVVAPATGQAR
jgi:hypothetical protein